MTIFADGLTLDGRPFQSTVRDSHFIAHKYIVRAREPPPPLVISSPPSTPYVRQWRCRHNPNRPKHQDKPAHTSRLNNTQTNPALKYQRELKGAHIYIAINN